MKNQVLTEGKVIPFTAGANLTAGDLVAIGSLVGIVCNTVASSAKGEAALKGVYNVPKEADEIAVGAVLYLNAGNKTATTTVGSNKVIGYAWAAAGTAATTVDVKLLF